MTAVDAMRFLTRERIGFKVAGIDAGPGRHAAPRCTRWFRSWRTGDVLAVVDYQHTTFIGPPYWQVRLRFKGRVVEFKTGPRRS